MSMKRILAVAFVFFIAWVGWWMLGSVTAMRSSNFKSRLGAQVEKLWGNSITQEAPTFAVKIPGTDQVRWLMPSHNEVNVKINTDYRKKGLMWYPTYTCSFHAKYIIENSEEVTQKIKFHFDFPSPESTYDNFAITIDHQPSSAPIDTKAGISEIIELESGKTSEFHVAYKTRGCWEWRYQLDRQVGRVQNLFFNLQTNFRNIDYTTGSLSPMSTEENNDGLSLSWEASDLITHEDIGVIIPEKLNPGPLTSRITFFAPVCLIFFFVLIMAISILYKVNIHPMHFLFVAAGFFAFHLLLVYLVDILHIHISFIVSAIISVVLVTGYLSAALGKKFPWKIAIAGQLFFLVLFSYSFFLKGMTGLTVAVGSVLTLAVLMRVTAKVDWSAVFQKTKKWDHANNSARPV